MSKNEMNLYNKVDKSSETELELYDIETSYECSLCKVPLADRKAVVHHFKELHPSQRKELNSHIVRLIKVKEQLNTKIKYECSICRASLNDQKHLFHHLYEEHREEIDSIDCRVLRHTNSLVSDAQHENSPNIENNMIMSLDENTLVENSQIFENESNQYIPETLLPEFVPNNDNTDNQSNEQNLISRIDENKEDEIFVCTVSPEYETNDNSNVDGMLCNETIDDEEAPVFELLNNFNVCSIPNLTPIENIEENTNEYTTMNLENVFDNFVVYKQNNRTNLYSIAVSSIEDQNTSSEITYQTIQHYSETTSQITIELDNNVVTNDTSNITQPVFYIIPDLQEEDTANTSYIALPEENIIDCNKPAENKTSVRFYDYPRNIIIDSKGNMRLKDQDTVNKCKIETEQSEINKTPTPTQELLEVEISPNKLIIDSSSVNSHDDMPKEDNIQYVEIAYECSVCKVFLYTTNEVMDHVHMRHTNNNESDDSCITVTYSNMVNIDNTQINSSNQFSKKNEEFSAKNDCSPDVKKDIFKLRKRTSNTALSKNEKGKGPALKFQKKLKFVKQLRESKPLTEKTFSINLGRKTKMQTGVKRNSTVFKCNNTISNITVQSEQNMDTELFVGSERRSILKCKRSSNSIIESNVNTNMDVISEVGSICKYGDLYLHETTSKSVLKSVENTNADLILLQHDLELPSEATNCNNTISNRVYRNNLDVENAITTYSVSKPETCLETEEILIFPKVSKTYSRFNKNMPKK